MKIFYSLQDFIDANIKVQSFVPTMGNLHEGHLSLINAGKKYKKNTCVSIYINEGQFNNKKDFDNYPRTIEDDIKKLESCDVEYVLIPKKSDIEKYTSSLSSKFEPKTLTSDLCGKYRPGHFYAVMDIIYRFFQIIKPEMIVLGEKDYQQLIIIAELIRIMKYDIRLISSPTIRNTDGLALSSRNNHLTKKQKELACDIYKALHLSKELLKENFPIEKIYQEIDIFFSKSPIKLEYFAIRDLKTLQQSYDNDLIALISCYVGNIRLIDNLIIRSFNSKS